MGAAYPNLLSDVNSGFESVGQTWSASGGNVTLSVVSAQYLSGSQSLRLSPISAGTIAAISPRCLVTEGIQYEARVPIRTSATTAGKVATVRITWFDATTNGSSIAPAVDMSVNLSTATGWPPDNYAVCYGVAPAGAKSATVKITVDGVAAAEYINIDDVFMVRVDAIPGNMLDLDDSSIEGSTAGWSISGATKGRVALSLVTGSGFACMVMTATAAAQSVLSLATPRPVTPGTEYLGYGRFFVPSPFGTTTVTAELGWLDAGGTLVSTTSSPSWTVQGSGGNTPRLNVVGVAPVGAAQVVLRFLINNPATGHRMYAEEFFLGEPPNRAGNMLSYDEFSSEMELSPWTVSGATIEQAPLQLNHAFQDGAYVLSIAPTGDDLVTLTLDRLIPVSEGETYLSTFSLWALIESDTSRRIVARPRMDWFDAAGTLVESDSPDQFFESSGFPPTYTGISIGETRTAPVGAAFGRFALELDPSHSTLAAYYLDNSIFEVSLPEYTVDVSDEKGLVTITVPKIAAGGLSGTYSVTRVHQDGSMNPVRGYAGDLVRVPYTEVPLVIEDYEAPLGESIWYLIDWFDAVTGVRTQRQTTRTLASPTLADGSYVWFKSPGIPAFNVLVMMETAIEWARAGRSSVLPIVGRKNPVHITGRRAGGTASLSLLVWDEPSNELLNSLLDPGAPALIQAMPGYGLDGNLYISIGDADSQPMTAANEPGWRWTIAVTEIDRPVGGIQGSATATWQDPYEEYADWGELAEKNPTWADILLA